MTLASKIKLKLVRDRAKNAPLKAIAEVISGYGDKEFTGEEVAFLEFVGELLTGVIIELQRIKRAKEAIKLDKR